jgi:aarF domain-containing kinase
MRIA